MTTLELESRLHAAASIAVPPQSVADDVMRRLGPSRYPVRRSRWRRPRIAAALAAVSGIAAIVAFVLFSSGSADFTMADVQHAVEQQHWLHVRYDAGQIKEQWVNLQTGEFFFIRYDGDLGYVNEAANLRLWYWRDTEVIDEDAPTVYADGQKPAPWAPSTAWSVVVAPLAQAASTTQPASPYSFSVVVEKDTLDGRPMLRFDGYAPDALGKRTLLNRTWADPKTHLPVRVQTHLQFGERQRSKMQEWSTGDYYFPPTGPTDIYALGVPKGTPIHKQVTVAPDDVRPILDGIAHAQSNFFKRYRAVVWTVRPNSPPSMPIESLNIIWRDGDKLREDYHLPGFELQNHPNPPLGALTADALLAWGKQHEPIQKQLMDETHEYSWDSVKSNGKPESRVLIRTRGPFPLLIQDAWPEGIQWPLQNIAPDFLRLPTDDDTPSACVRLRTGGLGNVRGEFFIDPANDFLCVKQIDWIKHGDGWAKTRQMTLSDLHRVAGRVVAGTMRVETDNPADPAAQDIEITTIRLAPLDAGQIPAGTFDPAEFSKGATVITH